MGRRLSRRPRKQRRAKKRSVVRYRYVPVARRNTGAKEPWVGAFSGLPENSVNLVVFPVNSLSVTQAARAYDYLDRHTAYMDAVNTFLQAYDEMAEKASGKPSQQRRQVFLRRGRETGGAPRLSEEKLGDLLDDVKGFFAEHPPATPDQVRVKEAADLIYSDLSDRYSGLPENYLPLGLDEEVRAMVPSPNFGILDGDGLRGLTPLSQSQLRSRVEALARSVRQATSGKPASVYESLGKATTGTKSLSLAFLATGPMTDPYALAPLGIEGSAATADALLDAVLAGGMWDFSQHAWRGNLAMALPTPVGDEEGSPNSVMLADTLCSPTYNLEGQVFLSSKDFTIQPKLLLVFDENGNVASGSFSLDGGALTWPIVSSKRRADGTWALDLGQAGDAVVVKSGGWLISVKLEASMIDPVDLGPAAQSIEEMLPEGQRWNDASYVLRPAGLGRSCPSPKFSRTMRTSLSRLEKSAAQDPFRVLLRLRRGTMSDQDRKEIDNLLLLSRGGDAIARSRGVLSYILDQLSLEARGRLSGSFDGSFSKEDLQRSPLYFSGDFGGFSDVSIDTTGREFPLTHAALSRVLASPDKTFTVKEDVARQLDLSEVPKGSPKGLARAHWDRMDDYWRWIVYRSGKGATPVLYRVHLINVRERKGRPVQWTYKVERETAAHVAVWILSREAARAAETYRLTSSLRHDATKKVMGLIKPLAPALKSLPITFVGTYCEDPDPDKGGFTQCSDAVRKALIARGQLPLPFYMLATDPTEYDDEGNVIREGGPSWYGDAPGIRGLPSMRHSALEQKSRGGVVVPTMLLISRKADSGKQDELTQHYRNVADGMEFARHEYTMKSVKEAYAEGGPQLVQLYENELFVEERKPRKLRGIPLTTVESVRSPVKKMVVTLYGVLDAQNVGVMASRASRGPDAAYAAWQRRTGGQPDDQYGIFFQKTYTLPEIEGLLREYAVLGNADREREEDEKADATAKVVVSPSVFDAVTEGGRRMLFQKRGKGRGIVRRIRLTEDVEKDPRKALLYARSWGKLRAKDFLDELGEKDVNRGALRLAGLLGLNWRPDENSRMRWVDQLARHPDLEPDLRRWLTGMGSRLVQDLMTVDQANEKDFPPLPRGGLQLNQVNALRKAILDQAGVTWPSGGWKRAQQYVNEPAISVWEKSEGEAQTRAKARAAAAGSKSWKEFIDPNDEGILPLPFTLVGALQVDLDRLVKLPATFPKARREGQDGLYLFDMRIPTAGGNIPREDELRFSLFTEEGVTNGLTPTSSISSGNWSDIAENLVNATWDKSARSIVGTVGTPWEKPGFFGFENIAALKEQVEVPDEEGRAHLVTRGFADKVEAATAAYRAQRGEDPPQGLIQRTVYYDILGAGLAGISFSSTRPTKKMIAHRRAYASLGGWQARSSRALHRPDYHGRVFGIWGATGFTNVFSFALGVCKQTGCTSSQLGRRGKYLNVTRPPELPFLPTDFLDAEDIEQVQLGLARKRTVEVNVDPADVAGAEEGKAYLAEVGRDLAFATVRFDDEDVTVTFRPYGDSLQEKLWSRMLRHEVDMPEVPDADATPEERRQYAAEVKQALLDLKAKLQVEYRHAAHQGELLSDLEDEDPEVQAFAKDYLGRASRKNRGKKRSKYGRKPRKPRRRGRRNPLKQGDVDLLEDYVDTSQRGSRPPPEVWQAAEGALREQWSTPGAAPPEMWDITPEKIEALFPTRGKRGDWQWQTRVKEALGPGRYDMLTRLSSLGPENTVNIDGRLVPVSEIVEDALKLTIPWQSEKDAVAGSRAVRLMMDQAQLNLDQVLTILDLQKESAGRKGGHAIPASTAICKSRRWKKLDGYTVPPAIRDAIDYAYGSIRTRAGEMPPAGSGWKNSILILLSPKGAAGPPRVMTWRRGAHLDCDMVARAYKGGPRPDEIELLGKAIQSAMYWIAESPKRRALGRGAVSVYVARIGSPKVWRAWSSGEELNLATINKNLTGGPVVEAEGYDAAQDAAAYDRAARFAQPRRQEAFRRRMPVEEVVEAMEAEAEEPEPEEPPPSSPPPTVIPLW